MKPQTRFNPPKQIALVLALLLVLLPLTGCGKSDDDSDNASYSPGSTFSYGYFIDSAVEGLSYTYNGSTYTTDKNGRFKFSPGGSVTFSIGTLELGTATGATWVTPLDIVPGAVDATNQIVNNILVLIQILDEDGDLNNGIKINDETAAIVSQHAGEIDFDQDISQFAFPTSLTNLLTDLNAAGVFTDAFRGPRGFQNFWISNINKVAQLAREHFENTLKERVTRNTTYGQVSGFAPDNYTYQWRGIPYAAPPIGDLRWKPPEEPASWSGVREAVAYGNQSAQDQLSAVYGEGGVSEDCLYLNITAPRGANNLPVMVWLHGGFFSVLSANTSAYNNPDGIAARGIILVTVNHRLGPFGYLAHEWLSAESSYGGSGNYGQMDLIMALEWVQNNIAQFGGNPNNVTIFGESGGGTKVLSLMTASETWLPRGAPLFHRAICQSGITTPTGKYKDDSILPYATLAEAELNGAKFESMLENALDADFTSIDDLRNLTWQQIVDNAPYQNNEKPEDEAIRYAPNVDIEPNESGGYMVETFQESFAAGHQFQVPFIAGTTQGDGRYITPGFTALMPVIEANHKQPVYAYVFKHVPKGWRDQGVKAYHAIELAWLFNSAESFPVHVAIGLPQRTIDFCNPDSITNDELNNSFSIDKTEFATVVNYMVTMWTNFAIDGDPSYSATQQWAVYTSEVPQYLEISTDLTMRPNLSDDVFPEYPPCE